MLGAIAGDIIGSAHEYSGIKTKDFPLFSAGSEFTDDSVLTIAVADAILKGCPYIDSIREIGRLYPDCGYGGSFYNWLFADDPTPYNSWGNGSAMRVSAVGFAFESIEEVMEEAKKTAEITHNHPEGIKGAQATAVSVFLARKKEDKETIKTKITALFKYDLDRKIDDIRTFYRYDISCQGTVPEAIIAFLESISFEDAIRNAVSLGGDADTLACITGGIAHAYYRRVPKEIEDTVLETLDSRLKEILMKFTEKCQISY
jgi:ADP-ribosylglycohydrolase